MKQVLLILCVTITLIACHQPNKEIEQRILNSDSMAINFFKGDGTMDTVLMVKVVRDKQQINQLAHLIGRKEVNGSNTCGYDGSLHFFKMNRVTQDIYFRMSPGECMHFRFVQGGKVKATDLSEQAKEMISSFRRNK